MGSKSVSASEDVIATTYRHLSLWNAHGHAKGPSPTRGPKTPPGGSSASPWDLKGGPQRPLRGGGRGQMPPVKKFENSNVFSKHF